MERVSERIISLDMSPFSQVVREMTHGMWFILCISLLCIFVWYSWRFTRGNRWPYDLATRAAMALSVYFLAASIRSGLLWFQWLAIGNRLEYTFWKDAGIEFLVASIISVIGGFLVIKVFAPKEHCLKLTSLVIFLTIAVPVLMFYLV